MKCHSLNKHIGSSSSSKSPKSTSSPQPEDLSLGTKQTGSGEDDEDVKIDSCDEADDENDEDDDTGSNRSKSPAGGLKFSIDAILGSKESKGKRRSLENYGQDGSIPNGCPVLVPEMPSPGSSPARHLQARFGGSGIEGCEDEDLQQAKDSEGEDKMMDGISTEGQRFSWLQCTRYEPPKLPRKLEHY